MPYSTPWAFGLQWRQTASRLFPPRASHPFLTLCPSLERAK